MSNLAIVAIPTEDDYVHKISSEKVPHCTLLFLGDIENKPIHRIASFLQHAVETIELGPFGLEVDYRGTLGEDDADVVFFKKVWWSARRVEEFRGQLLKNNEILQPPTKPKRLTSLLCPWMIPMEFILCWK